MQVKDSHSVNPRDEPEWISESCLDAPRTSQKRAGRLNELTNGDHPSGVTQVLEYECDKSHRRAIASSPKKWCPGVEDQGFEA